MILPAEAMPTLEVGRAASVKTDDHVDSASTSSRPSPPRSANRKLSTWSWLSGNASNLFQTSWPEESRAR